MRKKKERKKKRLNSSFLCWSHTVCLPFIFHSSHHHSRVLLYKLCKETHHLTEIFLIISRKRKPNKKKKKKFFCYEMRSYAKRDEATRKWIWSTSWSAVMHLGLREWMRRQLDPLNTTLPPFSTFSWLPIAWQRADKCSVSATQSINSNNAL